MPFGVVSESFERKASNTVNSRFLFQALIQMEDRRFFSHKGVDLRGIARATLVNLTTISVRQGGSTITQQLARSLLNDFRRSLLRKGREMVLALVIERCHSKEQILARYFDCVRWGGNIVGIRAAALSYFGREVHRLSRSEQLALLTLLRGPNFYLSHPIDFERRLGFIQRSLLNARLLRHGQVETAFEVVNRIKPRRLEIFKPSTAELLSRKVQVNNKTIITTIERYIQEICSAHVLKSAYPTSIVVLRNGVVVGLQSTYGCSHVHEFRFNVGSTLKPFVYTYLRRNGYSADQSVGRLANDRPWLVKEASELNPEASLRDALLHSWNAPFVACAYELGMEKVLSFLARALDKPVANLFPSSILGATSSGLSLLEISQAYSRFFSSRRIGDPFVRECHGLLKSIAIDKLALPVAGPFLKTGTSNDNRERLVVGGHADITFAVLREGSRVEDPTKSGGFMSSVRSFFDDLIGFDTNARGYKWI